MLKSAPRHLLLWNPKPTFRSKCTTKVCAVLINTNPRFYFVTLFLQLFQNRPKLAGRTPSLGHAPATSVISSRAQVVQTHKPFANFLQRWRRLRDRHRKSRKLVSRNSAVLADKAQLAPGSPFTGMPTSWTSSMPRSVRQFSCL